MTNETGMDIFKAFSDLSRMDKEDFARYVVNNLANRSRERLLFYLAADFLEFIQGNNDFTTKQIKKLVSLGINLGKEWTLQNLLDCLPLRVDRVPQTKWIRVVNPNEEYEECLDSDGDYPNISGHFDHFCDVWAMGVRLRQGGNQRSQATRYQLYRGGNQDGGILYRERINMTNV